jgi:hypothetical protein
MVYSTRNNTKLNQLYSVCGLQSLYDVKCTMFGGT